MLVERDKIVTSYFNLWDETVHARDIGEREFLLELPPFATRLLSYGKWFKQNKSLSQSELYTGDENANLSRWKRGELSTTFLMEAESFPHLSHLPLEGLKVDPMTEFVSAEVFKALDEMYESDRSRLSYLCTWTSLIVWMTKKMNVGDEISLLTSSTFPHLPHTTFISNKALTHIPPNSVYKKKNLYALKENLYHEACHQEMSALLLHEDVLHHSYDASTVERIPVPWRGSASWEPDRVLHAVYVYSRLIPMRFDYLNKGLIADRERSWLMNASEEGLKALTYLNGKLKECEHHFSEAGKVVLNQIILHADSVEDTYKEFVSS